MLLIVFIFSNFMAEEKYDVNVNTQSENLLTYCSFMPELVFFIGIIWRSSRESHVNYKNSIAAAKRVFFYNFKVP